MLRRSSGADEFNGKPLANEMPDRALKAGIALVAEQSELKLRSAAERLCERPTPDAKSLDELAAVQNCSGM